MSNREIGDFIADNLPHSFYIQPILLICGLICMVLAGYFSSLIYLIVSIVIISNFVFIQELLKFLNKNSK